MAPDSAPDESIRGAVIASLPAPPEANRVRRFGDRDDESDDGEPGRKRQKLLDHPRKRMSMVSKLLCGTLLTLLMNHEHGFVFNEPVDPVKFHLPDYHQVIFRPMDLGTAKNKLDSGLYSSPYEFAEDVRLTFRNAMEHPPPELHWHIVAEKLLKMFEKRWVKIRGKLEQEEMRAEVNDRVEALAAVRKMKKRMLKPKEIIEMRMNLERMLLNPSAALLEDLSWRLRMNARIIEHGDVAWVADLKEVENDTLWGLRGMVSAHSKLKRIKHPTTPEDDISKLKAAWILVVLNVKVAESGTSEESDDSREQLGVSDDGDSNAEDGLMPDSQEVDENDHDISKQTGASDHGEPDSRIEA